LSIPRAGFFDHPARIGKDKRMWRWLQKTTADTQNIEQVWEKVSAGDDPWQADNPAHTGQESIV
jgi:hypothetical protein